ncbi:uncharacterized protein LOC131439066 [Malaya genurostris]|uniref:uncharacterized protein LOC131439066 n=1 Tax=Malaya genurostris TaxID=325434 RepID=UPI0026F39D80|nr:uncharacterized protein LOC131439066 [Malaya genurostris]
MPFIDFRCSMAGEEGIYEVAAELQEANKSFLAYVHNLRKKIQDTTTILENREEERSKIREQMEQLQKKLDESVKEDEQYKNNLKKYKSIVSEAALEGGEEAIYRKSADLQKCNEHTLKYIHNIRKNIQAFATVSEKRNGRTQTNQ